MTIVRWAWSDGKANRSKDQDIPYSLAITTSLTLEIYLSSVQCPFWLQDAGGRSIRRLGKGGHKSSLIFAVSEQGPSKLKKKMFHGFLFSRISNSAFLDPGDSRLVSGEKKVYKSWLRAPNFGNVNSDQVYISAYQFFIAPMVKQAPMSNRRAHLRTDSCSRIHIGTTR